MKKDLANNTSAKFIIWGLYCISPSFCLYWFFFNEIDPDTKYDFFIFVDFSQKLKWYVIDGFYYLELILAYGVIYWLVKTLKNKKITYASLCIFLFSILRMVEYWGFRYHISFMGIAFGISLVCIMLSWQWLRK